MMVTAVHRTKMSELYAVVADLDGPKAPGIYRRPKTTARHCFHCRELVPAGKKRLCGGCELAWFCDASCQAAAWRHGHKADCCVPGSPRWPVVRDRQVDHFERWIAENECRRLYTLYKVVAFVTSLIGPAFRPDTHVVEIRFRNSVDEDRQQVMGIRSAAVRRRATLPYDLTADPSTMTTWIVALFGKEKDLLCLPVSLKALVDHRKAYNADRVSKDQGIIDKLCSEIEWGGGLLPNF